MDLETSVVRPIRDAIRSLLRSPGYTATALLSVGGAIGLSCSVYAVVVSIFLTPPPFQAPDRIVQFWQTAGPRSSQPQDYLQPVRMEEWIRKEDFRTLAEVAGTGMGPTLVLRSADGGQRVTSAPVVGDWFGLLGVPAAKGRVLTPEDLRPGAPPAAVVSDSFWREYLSGEDLGEMVLSGARFTVVGVMPPSFEPGRRVWIATESLPAGYRPAAFAGLARLRPGASPEEGAAEIEHLAAVQVEADSARYAGLGATARPLGELGRRGESPGLWMLAGVVLAVLLVALNNLTVLTLVRAQGRSGALAVRASLGASSWQLGRGLATEGAVIGLFGAGLGVALAVWGKDLAWAFLGGFWTRPSVDGGTVGLALGLGVLTAMLIGIEPMRRLGSLNLQALLQRRTGGSGSTVRERRTRQVLVAAQVMTCAVLLVVVSVLAMAYQAFADLDMGADVKRVVEVHPDWEVANLESTDRWNMAEILARRLEATAGLEGATAWLQVGEDYPPRPEFEAVIEGAPPDLGPMNGLYTYHEVRPGFFEILGLDIVQGRRFTATDARGGTPVAVVSERAAEVWWPGQDPLGRQVKLGEAGQWMTVVGVSEDMQGLTELSRTVAIRRRPAPALFIPVGQFVRPPEGWREFECCDGVRIGARAATPGGRVVRTVRELVAQAAPDLPLIRVSSIYEAQMDGYVGRSIRDLGRLVGFGMLIALVLSLVGIVGVVGEAVHRRIREIGVRIALGARRSQIAWIVGRESFITALSGLGVALALLFVLREWMSKVILDVYVQWLAPDLVSVQVLVAASTIVLVVTIGATHLAARRAFRINPVDAPRAD